jgi:glutaminase
MPSKSNCLNIEKSPILRSLSANRRPSQFLDVTPVNEGDIAEILHGDANITEVAAFLKECGFSEEFSSIDPRLGPIFSDLKTASDSTSLSCFELTDLKRNHLLLQKALNGELAIPDFKAFTEIVSRIYSDCRQIDDGAVASYIPQLAEVDSSLFGVSICTVDGQRFNIGDSQTVFSVQSVSKVISYAIALEANGLDKVHQHVGMEPSGRNFNERVLLPSGIPHNPLINTGAIMVASLLYPEEPRWKRFEKVSDFWKRLTGASTPSLLQSTFLAERETANRNFGLAHMMAENDKGKLFPQDLKSIQTILDEYFSYCSLGVTTEAMAQAAATLANGGLNPISDDRVFSPGTVTAVLSTMMTCGLYDASGEFSATSGFPAKSGVSGIIMAVIPGVCGICTFSPKIDNLGNSVRGLRFFAQLARHAVSTPLYNTPVTLQTSFGNQFEWRTSGDDQVLSKFTIREFTSLWWAAYKGDDLRIRQLAARGIDVNEANYSNRTAMNFAISAGNFHTVKLLVNLGASLNDPELLDSYLQDAIRVKREDIVRYLDKARSEPVSDEWMEKVEPVLTLSRIPLYRYFAGYESPYKSLEEALASSGIAYKEGGRLGKTEVRALCGKLIIPNWAAFLQHARNAITGTSLSLAICSIDSQHWVSDTEEIKFAIDAIGRVVLYELAISEVGEGELHKYVGREPLGQSESTLRMNSDKIPYNALTMSGCLTVCHLLLKQMSFESIINRLCERLELTFSQDDSCVSIVDDLRYQDLVQCTQFWLSWNGICSASEESFKLFKSIHQLAVTLPVVAKYAQTLATQSSPLLALLYTSGVDEHSGEFSFRFGVPARTSLSGTVMGVVPGVMGYAVRQPSPDTSVLPASVVEFQTRFGKQIKFHMFERHTGDGKDPTLYFGSNELYKITKFLSSAFHGDLSTMKHLVAEGLDVNCQDMDGRTALHISNGVGNFVISEWLISVGANENATDVWGMTPNFDFHSHIS